MKNSELEQLINDKLNSAAISDFAPNGLQVEGRETVHKIVTGVTACRERCWMRPSVCRRMR